jgi:hypothetical protein
LKKLALFQRSASPLYEEISEKNGENYIIGRLGAIPLG